MAPTLIAGAAWFGMTALMLRTPFAMVGCGIGTGGVMGAIAWHVVAMYAPAPFVVPLARKIGTGKVALAGLALILAASVLASAAATETGFAGVLVLIAIGWSLATAACDARLARERRAVAAAARLPRCGAVRRRHSRRAGGWSAARACVKHGLRSSTCIDDLIGGQALGRRSDNQSRWHSRAKAFPRCAGRRKRSAPAGGKLYGVAPCSDRGRPSRPWTSLPQVG